MLVRICDTLIDWRSDDCPADMRPFVVSDSGAGEPDLVVELEDVDILPELPEPEYEILITEIAHDGEVLLGWNKYEGFETSTALLRLKGARATIVRGPDTWECSVLNMLMLALLPVVSLRDSLLMHASLIDYEGRAVDWFFRPVSAPQLDRGWLLSQWLVAHADRLEVQHVIFDDHVWSVRSSAAGWRDYRTPEGASEVLRHRDHVHMDVLRG